jgi:dTDP-4-dehydrorhamnose reductase
MILVTGGKGQLGRSLAARLGDKAVIVDVDQLDITNVDSISRGFDAHHPRAVINAAAYTGVDKAESERAQAFAINRNGARLLGAACAREKIPFLHVSTDYVFDGTATTPYVEDAPRAPMGVYGESKAAGEDAVHELGGTVVRTSWLFAEGGPSFVHTMLRLAKDRAQLRVVADQHGCPTYAGDLADALLTLTARTERAPTYHYCNEGETTWHAFAMATIDDARKLGAKLAVETVEAITTAEYPTPARRPAYSVLDTSLIRSIGIATPPWNIGLARVVAHALSEK